MEYEHDLSIELQKRDFFLKKLRQCDQRIAALRALLADQKDAFDKALEDKLSEKQPLASEITAADNRKIAEAWVTPRPLTSVTNKHADMPKVRKDSIWPEFLRRLGADGASLDELEQFAATLKKPPSRASIRQMMTNFRSDGLILSDTRQGFYKPTEKGLQLLESLKGESPADLTATNSEGEAFNLQPSPDQGR